VTLVSETRQPPPPHPPLPPTGPPPSAPADSGVRALVRRIPLPTTLTARLVVTAVALVAVVCVLIAGATTLAIRNSLMDRLDADVSSLADSPMGGPRPDTHNKGPGTLTFIYTGGSYYGGVVGSDVGGFSSLPNGAADVLQQVPVDGRLRSVDIPGVGSYRVVAKTARLFDQNTGQVSQGVLVTGLPLTEVHDTVRNLVVWEVVLTLFGVVVAGAAGFILVRRQLRPLRQVAATARTVATLPLASGDPRVTSRVPAGLTDESTEVGQVGAALNSLLAHVEASLAARHRSEQQVRQFVADASHELRTPLTTIRGYTELARRRPDDAEAAATALAKVEEESGRMTSLVEDLLLLARLDQGRPLDREPVDLSRLLLEAVSDARVVAPDHHWVLALPDEPVEVTGDAQRLHQVVSNLLSNARAYTPAGTTVTVRASAGGFVVHDDGPGFAPDLVPVAFERFTRGESGRQRGAAAGGAGLGLSLVRAIVASHGGTVSLDSRPGDTSIAVRLPD